MPEGGGMVEKEPTNRQKQAWRTKNKIINCALQLFDEKGFSNVSMEMIAEVSETSIGAIYHYFTSKEEIAAQTLNLLDEQYRTYFHELLTGKKYAKLSPLEKLSNYFVYTIVKSSELKSLNYAYVYDLKNMKIGILGVGKERDLNKNYLELFQMCYESGELPRSLKEEEAVRIIVQVSRGLLVDWMLQGGGFDIRKQASAMIRVITAGMQQMSLEEKKSPSPEDGSQE